MSMCFRWLTNSLPLFFPFTSFYFYCFDYLASLFYPLPLPLSLPSLLSLLCVSLSFCLFVCSCLPLSPPSCFSLSLSHPAPVLPGAYNQGVPQQGYHGYMHQTSMSSVRSVTSPPHSAPMVRSNQCLEYRGWTSGSPVLVLYIVGGCVGMCWSVCVRKVWGCAWEGCVAFYGWRIDSGWIDRLKNL